MEKLNMHTKDVADANIEKIGQLFPNCLTERVVGKNKDGKDIVGRGIDFDKLKQELSKEIVEGSQERYQFTWPGKREAMRLANTPSNMTLRPDRESSVDFDNTENLYIEGDNLEVLKLLRENYLGKVKMIYIDPPYNTGNDFVYEDDFSETVGEFRDKSGMFDADGNMVLDRYSVNFESNGRFHTDWLNMMYPRLKVAKDLLTEDGVIFISIDDREADNLIKLCDEVFGESCFVGNISWQKTYSPRNDSKGIPAEKECIIVYGRQLGWMPKRLPRTEEMDAKYGNPDNDVCSWTSDNPCAPGAKTHQGMVYAIQHPFTGEMIYPAISCCWRYQQQEMFAHMNGWCEYELQELDDAVERARVCGVDASDVRQGVKAIVLKNSVEQSRVTAEKVLKRGQWPKFYFTKNGLGGIRRKTYLENVEGKMVTNLWPHSEVGHTDEAKKELKALFDGEIPFDTPKPVRLIQRMVQISSSGKDLVMDFFSGAATTAQSVMSQNLLDSERRRFVLVQIPEKVNNRYGTLCEIGKERIRRAGKLVKDDVQKEIDSLGSQIDRMLSARPSATASLFSKAEQQDMLAKVIKEQGQPLKDKLDDLSDKLLKLDTGFRVLKLDTSNMKDVYYKPEDSSGATLFEDNVKPGRSSEDLLFQVMLECNLPLSAKIEKKTIAGKEVFKVNDGYLLACFDTEVNETVITEVAKQKPIYFVMRDASISTDSVADNFEQIFNAYSKDTTRKIL